jgi:cysteine desulfuration protein SufE
VPIEVHHELRDSAARPICQPMTDTHAWPDDVAELIEDFKFLDGWEERYMHVIDLGKAMDPLPQSDQIDANKVQGCASQVWLVSDRDADGHLVFRGDSDAHIVSGLVAIAVHVFSHKPDALIRALDTNALFDALGLSEHLSSQRANGLRSMVARIKREASQ